MAGLMDGSQWGDIQEKSWRFYRYYRSNCYTQTGNACQWVRCNHVIWDKLQIQASDLNERRLRLQSVCCVYRPFTQVFPYDVSAVPPGGRGELWESYGCYCLVSALVYSGDRAASTGSEEVTAQQLQEEKSSTGCPTGGRGWRPGLYYLDQALFHMSTHLLLAPSQWGAAQRTYLAPLLRLPPLHLPYTGWKQTEISV